MPAFTGKISTRYIIVLLVPGFFARTADSISSANCMSGKPSSLFMKSNSNDLLSKL